MAWNLKIDQLKNSQAKNEAKNSRKRKKILLCELCSTVIHVDDRPKRRVFADEKSNKIDPRTGSLRRLDSIHIHRDTVLIHPISMAMANSYVENIMIALSYDLPFPDNGERLALEVGRAVGHITY